MNLWHYVVILACVVGIAAGQILFKHVARALSTSAQLWDPSVLAPFAGALAIYGIATISWIWVLQFVPLNRAYPFMALSFVLVPAASRLFFAEAFGATYVVGVGLICVGVIFAGR